MVQTKTLAFTVGIVEVLLILLLLYVNEQQLGPCTGEVPGCSLLSYQRSSWIRGASEEVGAAGVMVLISGIALALHERDRAYPAETNQ